MARHWLRAAAHGFTVALVHRLVLTVWLAVAWMIVQTYLPGTAGADFHANADANLPSLDSPAEQNLLAVWRRWDAVHYLNLAYNGYEAVQPGSTVFGVLTPLVLRVAALPFSGLSAPIDVGSIVVQTLAFGAALTLLYRFCTVYFDDEHLGLASIMAMALMPLSFYFAAPMSESLYLLLALAVAYASLRGRWLAAALFGFLAVLSRSQGVILAGVSGVFLLEQVGWRLTIVSTWRKALLRSVRVGWVLAFIPMGLLVFSAYRDSLGLPSLGDTYYNYSYHFFVNPLEGLWINIQWIAAHAGVALRTVDILVMLLAFVLTGIQIAVPSHRKLPLIAFTVGHLLVYLSKINWEWGSNEVVLFSQSFARYAIVLFPLVILIADGVRRLPMIPRLLIGGACGALLLIASGLYTVALVGP